MFHTHLHLFALNRYGTAAQNTENRGEGYSDSRWTDVRQDKGLSPEERKRHFYIPGR